MDFKEKYNTLLEIIDEDNFYIIKEGLISSDNLHNGLILVVERSELYAENGQFEKAYNLLHNSYDVNHFLIANNFNESSEQASMKTVHQTLKDYFTVEDSYEKSKEDIISHKKNFDKDESLFRFWRETDKEESSAVEFLGS